MEIQVGTRRIWEYMGFHKPILSIQGEWAYKSEIPESLTQLSVTVKTGWTQAKVVQMKT